MKRGFLLKAAGKNRAATKQGKGEQPGSSELQKSDGGVPQNIDSKSNLSVAQEGFPTEFRLPYGILTEEEKSLPTDYDKNKAVNLVTVEQGKVTDLSAGQYLFTTIPNPDDGDGTTEWIVKDSVAKLKLMKTKGYPTRMPKPHIPGLYEVRSTPDMGEAVFAKRNIKRGELIFSERPLLVAPSWMGGHSVDGRYNMHQIRQVLMFEFEKVLEGAVDRMGEKEKANYMALYNSHTADGTGPLFGIMRTNGFGATEVSEDDGPKCYVVICNLGSRINHSCMPNVDSKFRISSFSSQFVAVRDIKAGEQLFVSYCKLDRTKAERQTDLAPYGFFCICPACVNATPASDKLRKTYVDQVNHYVGWLSGPNCTSDALDIAVLLEQAMVAEGLDSSTEYFALLGNIFATFLRFGKMAEMTKYQKRMTEYFKVHNTLRSLPS